jgi:hypothetical protein
MRSTIVTFAVVVLMSAPAAAQQLTLSFAEGGRVTIDATSVPVRTILTKWAELGGTKVVGAERVSGAPLTVKLVDVPESQALETILRSVAGYMAAPRSIGTGASTYDRILILATSSVPAPAANINNNPRPTPNSRNGLAGTQRFVPPGVQQQADNDEPAEEDDPNPPNPPVFTFPQPGQQGGFAQPGMTTNAPGATFNPATGAPQNITINPAPPPAYQPANGMPVGSPVPGMIQPGMIQAPSSQSPSAPPPPINVVRPPGGR